MTQANNKDPGLLFVAALGQVLTRTGAWEETGRKFLATDHVNVPYIAMMLYARLAEGPQRDEARGVLEALWNRIDPGNWSKRLRAGHESAWREMLVGYYLNKVKRGDIFGPLEDDAKWANSDLHNVPLPRNALLCEAYFYEALIAEAEHNLARRNDRLQHVRSTKVRGYFEYRMAQFLLAQPPS